mmetsp:Transcript_124833/g.216332  ORF Transcript_124833/g.216332 Transcript_124833/m.216332 type:complete len:1112 (-) Transcript_124833:138-3473(-)
MEYTLGDKNVARTTGRAKICEKGGGGLVLPLTEREIDLPTGVRGFIYGFTMIYFFLGVSIVADTFMGAIEAVTSRKKQVRLKNGRLITLRVWNDTVANLTLMALGSSAPEILLSVIELLKNSMFSGELGPSTIVGSAAFNLLVIVALCVVVIPSPEIRAVKELSVFYVTLVFSLFAYLWLVIILNVITPDIVECWEAVLTFLCFPVLVWISWLADTGKFGSLLRRRQNKLYFQNGVPEELITRICDTLAIDPNEGDNRTAVEKALAANPLLANTSNISTKKVEELRAIVDDQRPTARKSRASRRIEATRVFTGGRKDGGNATLRRSWAPGNHKDPNAASKGDEGVACVQLTSERQTMSANLHDKQIMVVRSGDASFDLFVTYSVQLLDSSIPADGSIPREGTLHSQGKFVFEAEERVKELTVQRPWVPEGPPQDFLFCLTGVEAVEQDGCQRAASVGSISTTHVVISAACNPGKIAFSTERLVVPGTIDKQLVEVLVRRTHGCTGMVSCSFNTERLSAIPGYDYTESEGIVEFAEGQTEQMIQLEILPKGQTEEKDEFLVVLTDVQGGAEFDSKDDGGAESSILTVEILALDIVSSKSRTVLRRLDKMFNFDEIRLGNRDCIDQFVSAIYCNGSPEEQKEATKTDWVFHLVALPWKILFTLVPPTSYCGGWVCFVISLVLIGVVTAVIGDLAELFGCVFDVPDAVTAITFVALGTSMPDLFASQSAAVQDPTADASIINVTGSNSVNVFLGLGLPWTMGSIYWLGREESLEWQDRYPEVAERRKNAPTFVVPSGNLGFSVLVFTCCSITALVIVNLRRRWIGAELGGPFRLKCVSAVALVSFWWGFIILSSWQVLRDHVATSNERWTIISITGFWCLAWTVTCVICLFRHKPDPTEEKAKVKQAGKASAENATFDPDGTGNPTLEYGSEDLERQPPKPGENGEMAPRSLEMVLGESAAAAVASPDAAAGPTAAVTGSASASTAAPSLSPGALSIESHIPTDGYAYEPAFDAELEVNALDFQPVQPLPTPSVPALMSLEEPGDAKPELNQLHAQSLSLWNRSSGSPIVHLPNATRDALLIGQHEVTRSRSPPPWQTSSGTSLASPASPALQL